MSSDRLDPPVSSANKTNRHDTIKILLKVALNTIKQAKKERKKERNFRSASIEGAE